MCRGTAHFGQTNSGGILCSTSRLVTVTLKRQAVTHICIPTLVIFGIFSDFKDLPISTGDEQLQYSVKSLHYFYRHLF